MPTRPKKDGLLLYPGVVLRGGGILMSSESATFAGAIRNAKVICKVEKKPKEKKDRKVVNVLIED